MVIRPVIGFLMQNVGHSVQHHSSYCGIGIRGKLTSEILTNNASQKYRFVVGFIDSNKSVEQFIHQHKPSVIIYNYHCMTTPYLHDRYIINKYPGIKHVMIHYDLLQQHIDNFSDSTFSGFNYVITDNEMLSVNDNKNVFKVTRSIPYSSKINKYVEREDKIPIIGFQGFGLPHKGIHRVAMKVQEEFDEAIIRLHIPYSHYCDPNGEQARQRVNEVRQIIKKPGIKIMVTHKFLSDEEIIDFLNGNTINCYFYDYLDGSGIASSPDYAIAAYRPIAINNSRMFVNLQNLEPTIEIEKTSLKQIIQNGTKALEPIYKKYTHENVLRDYENICDKLLKPKKKALVLGSSGFIGGHLVKYLRNKGYYVVGCDIRDISYDIFTPNEFRQGDLRDINFINNLLKLYFYDEVYQLAADMGGAIYINSGIHDGLVMSNSVTINSNILRSENRTNIGKIFFSSSACVYPHTENDIARCQENDAYPAYPDNEYGWEKLFSERMYKAFERQYGINVFIARFHSIVGDYSVCFGDRSKAHSALALKVAEVEEGGTIDVIGDGKQVRTFLYVEDCIRGIHALMSSNCKEVVNIGSEDCITINEYLELLRKISGKNFTINYIDGPTGVKIRYCSTEKIRNICDWKPIVSLEDATRKTYNFIIEELKKQK